MNIHTDKSFDKSSLKWFTVRSKTHGNLINHLKMLTLMLTRRANDNVDANKEYIRENMELVL
jgi:hypothetical protein